MKKIISVLLFLSLMSTFIAHAQLKIESQTAVLMEKIAPAITLKKVPIRTREYLGFDGKNYCFLLQDRKTLSKVNESLQDVAETDIKKDEVKEYISKNDFMFYDVDDNTPTLKSYSDNQKWMVVITIDTKKRTFLDSEITVYDEKGKKYWSLNFTPEFENESFSFLDVSLSNDGEKVYLLAKSFSGKESKPTNMQLTLFRIIDSGLDESASIEYPNADYKNIRAKVLSNGNVFVGGFRFKKSGKKDDLESFSYLFSNENLELKNQSVTEYLPLANKESNKPDNVYRSSFHNIGVKIRETKEGVTMFGEEQSITNYYTNGVLTSVLYDFRNIFIDSYNTDGEPEHTSILFKKQNISIGNPYPPGAMPLSYDVYNLNDNLYLVYNDLSTNKNLPNNYQVKNISMSFGKIEKMSTFYCSIENGLIGKKSVLLDGNSDDKIVLGTVKQFDNHVLVYLQQKNVQNGSLLLGKLVWN